MKMTLHRTLSNHYLELFGFTYLWLLIWKKLITCLNEEQLQKKKLAGGLKEIELVYAESLKK